LEDILSRWFSGYSINKKQSLSSWIHSDLWYRGEKTWKKCYSIPSWRLIIPFCVT
jgi:hypothetical protein